MTIYVTAYPNHVLRQLFSQRNTEQFTPAPGDSPMNTSSYEALPDFAVLLSKALVKLEQHGTVPFTELEAVVIGHILGEETDPLDALGDRMAYEIDDLQIPKFVCLVMWLNPFGVASLRPKAVLRVTHYLLGFTRNLENQNLPLRLRRELGV